MSLKKKVTAGTLAASLAMTALAGIPLSSKGLAQKLGLYNVASAASISESQLGYFASQLKSRLSASKAVYVNSVANSVYVYSDSVSSVTYVTYDGHRTETSNIIKPVKDKIIFEKDSGLELTNDDEKNLELVFATLAKFVFDQETSQLNKLQSNESVRDTLRKIAEGANVGGLTVEDLNGLLFGANGIEALAWRELAKSSQSLTDLLESEEALRTFVKNVFEAYLNSDEKLAKTLKAYNVEAENLAQVVWNFRDAVDAPIFDKATAELVAAYIAVKNSPISGGAPGVSSSVLDNAKKELADIKAKLAAASDAEKQALIDQALKIAAEAIAKLAQFDASSLVKEVDGKAVVSLSLANLSSLFSSVEQLKTTLADAIGADNAAKLAKPTLAIDLGNTALKSSVVNLAKDISTKSKELNFGWISIKVSGAATKFPLSTLDGDVIYTLDRTAASASQTGGRPAVTDVFNYSLSVNGTVYDKFNEPVEIQLPVTNTSGVDTELLTVAKLDNGSLSIEGGIYNDGVLTEQRYTFSSYVGVENDVTFRDVASVQAWAGRQIKVVAAKGAIEGRGDGRFDPRANVTRAEFAKILVSALNLDNPNVSASKFTDVNPNAWYAPYVAIAAEKGIINGRSATKFDPNAPISRAEIATLIARALQVTKGFSEVKDVDAALANFSDAGKIPSSLKAGVAFAASKNIVIGTNGKFNPNDNASRAEAAVIVYRALNAKA